MVVRHVQQARPHGTTITVRDLFRNVPARLKFLKSTATENSHIAGVVSQYALAYPEVKFSLNIDGRATLQTSGNGKLMDVVIAVYGLETAKRMLEVNGGEVGWQAGEAVPITVTGMVGAPSINKAGREALSFLCKSTGYREPTADPGRGGSLSGTPDAGAAPHRHYQYYACRRRKWMSIFTRPKPR